MWSKVSILLCTYNAQQYIDNTIKSILNQTYNNFELLILDDNSKDNTRENIQAHKDPRIQLFTSQKNLWPYAGLNFLLAKVTWTYIAIQDHDDIRHPQKLEKQIYFLENNHKYIWCGTKTLMRYEWDQKWFEYYLWEENYYTIHPSLVFRNDKKYRYPNTVYMADALFQKQILCKEKKIIYNLDETLTMHRIKNGATNYSYKRYKLTIKNLKTVFELHPVRYALAATAFEIMRKIIYPILHLTKTSKLIDKIERLPFKLQGYKMGKYNFWDIKKRGFNI